MFKDPGPDASHLLDLLLGRDDDGGPLHLDVQLLGLVLLAVQADLKLVIVVLDTGVGQTLVSCCCGLWVKCLFRGTPCLVETSCKKKSFLKKIFHGTSLLVAIQAATLATCFKMGSYN